MNLTDDDKKLLDGGYGEAAQVAMRVLVAMGENVGADEMVSISMMHDDSAWFEGVASVEFAEYLVKLGGTFRVPTSTNACIMDLEKWQELGFTQDLYAIHKRIEKAHTALGGAASWTCTPYMAGFVPRFGEHVAWAESNATAYVNSIIGARTERYAGLLDLCAGLTGRVPYYGLHKTENRQAQIHILCDDFPDSYFENDAIYDILGYSYGTIVGDTIGALEGLPTWSKIDNLKRFSATASSSGGVGLFHLIGLTPEAQTRQMAFGDTVKTSQSVLLTKEMLLQAEEKMSKGAGQDIQLVTVGCPHASYAECRELYTFMAGRPVHNDVEFWLFTSRANKMHMLKCGLFEALQSLGIKIYTDGCPMSSPIKEAGIKNILSNSGKFSCYCYSYTQEHPQYGSLADCAETAISGKLTRSVKPWW